jgi:ferredoxin
MSEQWPNITDQKDPLPEAEEFKDTKDKKSLMEK